MKAVQIFGTMKPTSFPRPHVEVDEARRVMEFICENDEWAKRWDKIGELWMTGESEARVQECMSIVLQGAVDALEESLAQVEGLDGEES